MKLQPEIFPHLLVPPSTFWARRRYLNPFTNFSYCSRGAEKFHSSPTSTRDSKLWVRQGEKKHTKLFKCPQKKQKKPHSSWTELLSRRWQHNWRNAVHTFLYGERKGSSAAPGSRRKPRFGPKLKGNNSGATYCQNDRTAHAMQYTTFIFFLLF